jgi:hypothetical protein
MESAAALKMDSQAGVCYMNFGVDGNPCVACTFPGERPFAF